MDALLARALIGVKRLLEDEQERAARAACEGAKDLMALGDAQGRFRVCKQLLKVLPGVFEKIDRESERGGLSI